MPRPVTRKQDIIDAAVQLFVQKGVAETTIRDIATTAKVGEGTLYRHWASKDEMAHDLFIERFIHFGKDLYELYKKHATFSDRLGAMLNYILDFHDSDRLTFRFILLVQHHSLRYMEVIDEENPVEILHMVVKDGLANKEIREIDSQLAMSMLLGSFLQVAVSSIYKRLPDKLMPYRDEMYQSMMRMLSKE